MLCVCQNDGLAHGDASTNTRHTPTRHPIRFRSTCPLSLWLERCAQGLSLSDPPQKKKTRSDEHTSELQSHRNTSYAVF